MIYPPFPLLMREVDSLNDVPTLSVVDEEGAIAGVFTKATLKGAEHGHLVQVQQLEAPVHDGHHLRALHVLHARRQCLGPTQSRFKTTLLSH